MACDVITRRAVALEAALVVDAEVGAAPVPLETLVDVVARPGVEPRNVKSFPETIEAFGIK